MTDRYIGCAIPPVNYVGGGDHDTKSIHGQTGGKIETPAGYAGGGKVSNNQAGFIFTNEGRVLINIPFTLHTITYTQ